MLLHANSYAENLDDHAKRGVKSKLKNTSKKLEAAGDVARPEQNPRPALSGAHS